MRITPHSMSTAAERTGEHPAASVPGRGAEGADGGDGAVVVSSRTRQATAAAERSSVAHADKVARITAAVEAGTYKVDHQVLAERIVADELSRLGASA